MNNTEQYNFTHLEKNISDMVFEGMVKIGYMKDQSVSVYYDPGLLCYLLDVREEEMDAKKLEKCLENFRTIVEPHFPGIVIKYAKKRYEFCIAKEGVQYIWEHNQSREFLRKLVELLNEPSCTLEQITAVFREVSQEITIEEINHSEFQYVISFRDPSIDEFRYCFTFDEMGHYYHRLLDYDFEQVLHCECE